MMSKSESDERDESRGGSELQMVKVMLEQIVVYKLQFTIRMR